MIQTDEEHMNKELDYILKNKNISMPENISNSFIKIKYGFLLFKYINLLKEDSKKLEFKEKDLMKNINFKDNRNIIIIFEHDVNKIEIEKERIKNLQNEELLKEALIKSTYFINNLFPFLESKNINLEELINSQKYFINNINCIKFLNDFAHIKIFPNNFIEKEMVIYESSNNDNSEKSNNKELLEKDETIKKINTKSLEELLKEIYSDNKIDIRKLAEIF